jgi:hypothetical protein
MGGVLVPSAVKRLLSSLLFGVKAADRLAGSIAVLTLALVAFLPAICLLGGLLRVDPIVALLEVRR